MDLFQVFFLFVAVSVHDDVVLLWRNVTLLPH